MQSQNCPVELVGEDMWESDLHSLTPQKATMTVAAATAAAAAATAAAALAAESGEPAPLEASPELNGSTLREIKQQVRHGLEICAQEAATHLVRCGQGPETASLRCIFARELSLEERFETLRRLIAELGAATIRGSYAATASKEQEQKYWLEDKPPESITVKQGDLCQATASATQVKANTNTKGARSSTRVEQGRGESRASAAMLNGSTGIDLENSTAPQAQIDEWQELLEPSSQATWDSLWMQFHDMQSTVATTCNNLRPSQEDVPAPGPPPPQSVEGPDSYPVPESSDTGWLSGTSDKMMSFAKGMDNSTRQYREMSMVHDGERNTQHRSTTYSMPHSFDGHYVKEVERRPLKQENPQYPHHKLPGSRDPRHAFEPFDRFERYPGRYTDVYDTGTGSKLDAFHSIDAQPLESKPLEHENRLKRASMDDLLKKFEKKITRISPSMWNRPAVKS